MVVVGMVLVCGRGKEGMNGWMDGWLGTLLIAN